MYLQNYVSLDQFIRCTKFNIFHPHSFSSSEFKEMIETGLLTGKTFVLFFAYIVGAVGHAVAYGEINQLFIRYLILTRTK